jgi:hypothetical protein
LKTGRLQADAGPGAVGSAELERQPAGCGKKESQVLTWLSFFDGLVKSPSAALRGNFVVAAHPSVRLPPQFLRALHLEFFTKPSFR